MDFSGENSGDSLELKDIHLLSVVPSVAIPTHLTVTDPSALTVTDPSAILNGGLPLENSQNETQHPYVVIVEQPQQRGFRFRYECEGPSHGGLHGEKTERSHKTYPSIRVENYSGQAHIEVSLVTDENPPRIHAHKLVGKNCENGVCTMDINSTASIISFPNLCVLHVTRKKAAEVLLHRIMEDTKLNKQLMGINTSAEPSTSEESLTAKKQAQEQAKNMALSVVRLQFRVFLPNAEGQYLNMLPPVVSQPIYDSKAPGASALKICRMDKFGGCCTGNEEVFLLCERVQKEDIAVRFVEHNKDGSIKWEAYGNFSPLDVHRQYAIVFKTPAYFNANIDKAVNVMIMLQRKSDKEISEAKAFTYYPQNKDMDLIAKKKRKKLPLDSTFDYYNGDRGPGGGAAGPGGGMGGGFGPLGFGGFGGGGGGGGQQQGTYSVIMPNGNIVDQLNVLPTTVEQVVKEEFACSPETNSTEESYLSPQASPYFDTFWGPYFNDLEIDAAPSLRHSSQIMAKTAVSAPTKRSEVIPEPCDPQLKPDRSEEGSEETRRTEGEVVKSVTKPDADRKDCTLQQGKGDSTDTINSSDRNTLKDSKSDIVRKDAEQTAGDHRKVRVTIDNRETSEPTHVPKPRPDTVTTQSDTDSGRGERSDIMPSPTRLSDMTMSEGFKTDEGFSEASSVKEDQEVKKADVPNVTLPIMDKEGKGDTEEKGNKAVMVATSVIKRIMQKVTSKTIRALQDFSETGDPRYLLLVQRHLTAIKNENGDLPIHLAVINNQTTSLQHLLDIMMSLPNARQSINTYNYMRQTALHLAAIMQQPYHIELFLHSGADPSLADRNGNTPAHLAVVNNSLEALRSLVKYLRPGVSASNPFPELDYLNYDGYTPVHLAAQSGNVDMLRLLVHGQANVDLADGKSGRTALHHAVELDDLPVAGFLLMEASADVNARCFDGNTPLHVACCRGLIGMVALLMTAGALTDVENEEVPPEEDWEKEEEPEEGWRRCRRGLQPRDYVAGKDRLRILRMLMGDLADEEEHQTAKDPDIGDDPDLAVDPDLSERESHVPTFHTDLDDEGHGHTIDPDLEQDMGGLLTHKSTYDSGVAESLTSHSASSLSGKEKLSHEGHVALSMLLDPACSGKDVRELASRLGYSHLVPALEAMECTGSSPTQYLLDYNESYGSLVKLRECLLAMERKDAVEVLDQHL